MKTFYTNAKIFRNGRFEPGLIAVEAHEYLCRESIVPEKT